MTVVQISVSRGGVPKRSIPSGEVTRLGIVGDACAHPQIHGGPQQALLLITSEGIAELIAQGFPLYPGALGENLTTLGLDRRGMRIGQRYRDWRNHHPTDENASALRAIECLRPRHSDRRV